MGIATPISHHQQQLPHHISHHQSPAAMSHHHGFQHGFLSFPQSVDDDDGNTQGQARPHNTMDHSAGAGDLTSVYDPSSASSILSDILNFNAGTAAVPSATEFLASQIAGGWYAPTPAPAELFLMNPPPAPTPQHPRGYAGGPGQGLSLSLSSTLQQLEPTKPEDLFFTSSFLPDAGGQLSQSQPIHVAASLRQSKYARAAQDLLEEFCSVGRGQLKHSSNPNPNPNAAANAGGASSSTSKDPAAPPTLSASDRFEHQRKKTKLSSMLDEVDRRYNHYCDQMQMVVNSFDSVMGFGAAAPYTALARKAMSRHFRCLKDAIIVQLRRTCEALGEKDAAAVTGVTRGETPRLRLLDQSLRQQKAFNQMGMMEQEAWRPQRGLPERSVNILRAWLFEHFLHPYPNDADKHMLARQTGLSRNQVTNWFINARVRLWKPMVEEMYQQEAREEDDDDTTREGSQGVRSQSPRQEQYAHDERSEINGVESDQPSSSSFGVQIQTQHQHQHQHQHQQYQYHQQQHRFPTSSSDNHLHSSLGGAGVDFVSPDELTAEFLGMDNNLLANYNARMGGPGAQVRYGASGDVSLTLGLRHAGNMPENSHFTLRDFGGGGGGGGL